MTTDSIKETLAGMVNRLVGGTVERTMLSLEKRAITLQNNFFRYLATSAGVIDSASAPNFPNMPKWKELTPDYANRKGGREYTKKGAGGTSIKAYSDRFYYYTGALERYFLSGAGSAVNKFGKPLITYSEPGYRGLSREYTTLKTKSAVKVAGTFTAKGNVSKASFIPRGVVGSIKIDLFPKIDTFNGDFKTSQFFPLKVAYKLDNAQHGGNQAGGHSDRSRPFMNQYMQWWLRVKGAEMLRGAMK